MAEKDKYADEKLSDEELESVAGGVGYRDLHSIDFRFNQTPNPANDQNTPANQLGSLPIRR